MTKISYQTIILSHQEMHDIKTTTELAKIVNCPDVTGFSHNDAQTILQQHRAWESLLKDVPRGKSFRSCSEASDGAFPRQTAAFLLQELFEKQNTTVDDMLSYLEPHMCKQTSASLIFDMGAFNLLRLTNDSLRSLYTTVFESAPINREETVKAVRASKCRIDNKSFHYEWIQCDNCKKWRRLDLSRIDSTQKWVCTMEPTIIQGCATPEDVMTSDEKWDGLTNMNIRCDGVTV